jgi:hypothetical protein
VIRVLLHDTSKSTSLLSLANRKSINLVTSVHSSTSGLLELQGSSAFKARSYNGLVITKRDSNGEFTTQPSLGVKEHLTVVPAQRWWEQAVCYEESFGTLSRKELVLAAANKDGGAHVDLDIPTKYASVRAPKARRFRPAAANLSRTPESPSLNDFELVAFHSENEHFASLRQMAYELLLSEELLALCGQALESSQKVVYLARVLKAMASKELTNSHWPDWCIIQDI